MIDSGDLFDGSLPAWSSVARANDVLPTCYYALSGCEELSDLVRVWRPSVTDTPSGRDPAVGKVTQRYGLSFLARGRRMIRRRFPRALPDLEPRREAEPLLDTNVVDTRYSRFNYRKSAVHF